MIFTIMDRDYRNHTMQAYSSAAAQQVAYKKHAACVSAMQDSLYAERASNSQQTRDMLSGRIGQLCPLHLLASPVCQRSPPSELL